MATKVNKANDKATKADLFAAMVAGVKADEANAKATKATKATNAKATNAKANDKPFEARKARPGVAAIEAAGGASATITIVTPPRMVVGGADTSRAETCFAMLRKSRTIGDYLAARDKAGLGATLGGYLPGWVEKGFVKVGGKPTKATKATKANDKAASEPAKA